MRARLIWDCRDPLGSQLLLEDGRNLPRLRRFQALYMVAGESARTVNRAPRGLLLAQLRAEVNAAMAMLRHDGRLPEQLPGHFHA